MSFPWICRAAEVAGKEGALVGFFLWRLVKTQLPHGTRVGGRPGFVRAPRKWAQQHFPIHKDTWSTILHRLASAELVELHKPSPNSAYHVRILPFGEPWDVDWTIRNLGYDPRSL